MNCNSFLEDNNDGAHAQDPLAILYNVEGNQQDTEKSYKCNVCHQTFSQKCHLQDHSVIHTGEKPLACPVCDRRYNRKAYLQTHIKKCHTEEQAYECTFCHISFTENLDLRNHLNTHFDELGDKEYKCKVCNYTCKRKDNLQRHMLKHTGEMPFECHICHRKFGQKPHLQNHIRTHTGEKPFLCNVCQCWFNRKGNLQRHIMRHTGEKPFECDICQRKFAQKPHLQNHIIRTHVKSKIKFKRRKRSVKNRGEKMKNAKTNIIPNETKQLEQKPYAALLCSVVIESVDK